VMTLADDALSGVAATQRLAARSLGLTRAETALRVGLRQAFPGLVSALLLGLGRALGETIAVFLVIGRQDNQWPERLLSLRPLTEAGQTLTTKLGGSETFIAYGDPQHWGAIMGLGLVLFVVVGAISLAGARLATWRSGRA
jgi:phosphate transport system permease protein